MNISLSFIDIAFLYSFKCKYTIYFYVSCSPFLILGINDKKTKYEDMVNTIESVPNADDLTLMDEIRKLINELRRRGITNAEIKSVFEEIHLSRLVITKNYHIILTDYHIEIMMAALPKAVFLLYLNHPEGIMFKSLSDYSKELLTIYNNLTNRSNEKAILMSISDITDPTKNSINEKCARIHNAFVKRLDSSIAHYYYITGSRGKPKRILLPRKLVTYEK